MRNTIIFLVSSLIIGFGLSSLAHAKDVNNSSLAAPIVEAPAGTHDIWNTMLKMYVSADGVVNYKGFKNSEERVRVYLDQLGKNPPQSSWGRSEKMAYWINLYNAATVSLILKNYPLKSIRDLQDPWDKAFVKVGNKTYSLNQIEHEILRPRFQDPRIHFAVNCASKSCPDLLNEAFLASKLDQQLDKQTKKFINDSRHNSVQNSEVSQLFDWYKEDFTKNGTVVDFLNKYATTPYTKGKTLSYRAYDWGLNE